MKIWIDDVRIAPKGYIWIKSVNEFIQFIEKTEKEIKFFENLGHEAFMSKNYNGRNNALEAEKRRKITLIDIDHDAGEYFSDGGDYIKILDYLEEKKYNVPIHIHSMNPVGRENMRRIIKRNGWKEIL